MGIMMVVCHCDVVSGDNIDIMMIAVQILFGIVMMVVIALSMAWFVGIRACECARP